MGSVGATPGRTVPPAAPSPAVPKVPKPPSARTRLRRLAQRGRYDQESVYAILDEGLVGHVASMGPDGPVVLPMAYGRVGDVLYLHGAVGNAGLRALPLCVTVTLLDGLVLARSAFHHSMNYRSVVVFGPGQAVRDDEEKKVALAAIVDHALPGRSDLVRSPSPAELRATRVVRMVLHEASAKVRTGGPADEPADLDLEVWAGEIPVAIQVGQPVPDGPVEAPLPACRVQPARVFPGPSPSR